MKKTIIAGFAGAVVATGLGLAAPAQAAPCSYFSSDRGWERTFCGVPDAGMTVDNMRKNLQTNLNNMSPQNSLNNLKDNLDPRNWG
ncbi:MAG TPA: hypothetical protein VHT50_12255 [Mycobacterium sp.]|jgi:hypothetical protein|nr:hypothetical protein [Mycobacterium sp.]